MRMGVALRQFAAARERRLADDRDVGVLGDEQRFEAAVLQRARQLDDVDAVIGGKVKNPDLHVLPPRKVGAASFRRPRSRPVRATAPPRRSRAATTLLRSPAPPDQRDRLWPARSVMSARPRRN